MNVRKLFRKELEEVSYEDLIEYFKDPIEESDTIEYKSFASYQGQNDFKYKERKILKTICSFLNSSGGVIIWGAPMSKKDKDNKHILEKELSPINKIINKDSFISKILNKIVPTPLDIKCRVIEVSENRCIIILEITQSKNKPHQFESIYYMRADGQTIIAPHHYIEALFKQIKYPELSAHVEMRYFESKIIDNNFLECKINLFIENKSKFINETNLLVSLVIDNTYQEFKDESFPICHYGKEIVIIPEIRLPIKSIGKYCTAILQVLFGGEKSPLRCSRFLLQYHVSPVYDNSMSRIIELQPGNVEIIKREEDKFIFELDDENMKLPPTLH